MAFWQNLKNRVRKVHWIFQNLSRTPKIHQILAVCNILLFRWDRIFQNPSRKPQSHQNLSVLRYYDFSVELENLCTHQYTRIFRTPKETSKIHQILAVCNILLFRRNLKTRENRGPRGILCTRGEKEQTSIRQTNKYNEFVWSRARFATRTRPRKNLPRNVKISSKF